MPYCKTAFCISTRDEVQKVLSEFTQTHFAFGRAAYELQPNRYAIDAGENDIRAIYDEDKGIVRFFCRYAHDVTRYDKTLVAFADSKSIKTRKLR